NGLSNRWLWLLGDLRSPTIAALDGRRRRVRPRGGRGSAAGLGLPARTGGGVPWEETVTFMADDPFTGWGLRQVELADRPLLDSYFASLAHPLSDYTFSQLFTWSNSLNNLWKQIAGHLCVFANGAGDLTLLVPPIGDTGADRALA